MDEELKGFFNCRFKHEYSKDYGDNVQCRAHPPIAVLETDGEGRVFQAFSFPNVWRYCVCGEWQERRRAED